MFLTSLGCAFFLMSVYPATKSIAIKVGYKENSLLCNKYPDFVLLVESYPKTTF